jgi:hypothetical protein
MIGLPKGLDEQQWLQHMHSEHCGADPGAAAPRQLMGGFT